MCEQPCRQIPMDDFLRLEQTVSALDAVIDLLGSCDDLHVVDPDALSALLKILAQEMKTVVS